jgi:hypothetical protein
MWFSSENVHSEVWSKWSRGNLRRGTQNRLQAGFGVSIACEAEISQSMFTRRLEIMQISVEDWLCAPVNWWPLPRASRDMRLISKTSRTDQNRKGLIPSSNNDIEPNNKSDSSYTFEEAFREPSSTLKAPLIDVDESVCDENRPSLQAISAKYTFDIMQPSWLRRTQSFRPGMRIFRPIRIRVRYMCHLCGLCYGGKKECVGCRHRRCARCERYPQRSGHPFIKEPRTVVPSCPLLATHSSRKDSGVEVSGNSPGDTVPARLGKFTESVVPAEGSSSIPFPLQSKSIAAPSHVGYHLETMSQRFLSAELSAAGGSAPVVGRLSTITENQPSQRKLLFWCVNETTATVRLIPIEIENMNEREIAPALINAYSSLLGIKRLFSLTCLHSATLIKYSILVPDDRIVAPLCIAIPTSRLNNTDNGYDLQIYSAVPDEHIRWVEKNMAYRFGRPSCSRVLPLIQHLPKFVQEWTDQIPVEGYALYNVIAWSLARTMLWFMLVQIPPTIFAVRWLMGHHGDLQNAFEAETILLMMLGVFVVQRDRSKVFRGFGESV